MTESRFDIELVQTEPWPIAKHVFVIAEVGINHNGSLELAKRLVDMAKSTGCDAVKFQKRTLEVVYTQDFLDSPRESPWGTTQREQKEALEFGTEEFDEIDAYCRDLEIPWFASAWDVPSLEFLRRYDLPYNKVASPMLTHVDFVKAVAAEGKPTFVSTGMSGYDEIDRAVDVFRRADCPFVLMHTVSEYPAPEERLNLRGMNALRERYGGHIGYSGHEVSPIPSVLAAAMGAVAVERHITLGRAMYGSDQAASLERRGLEMLVKNIRSIPSVLGDGEKRVTPDEQAVASKLRYWETFEAETTPGKVEERA